MQIFENFSNLAPEEEQKDYVDPEDNEAIVKAKRAEPKGIEYEYTERDIMLYNLGIGAHATELQWTYENDQDFQPLPTFGVVPQFTAGLGDYEFLPRYNPGKLLHGEQYLSIKGKVPTSGKLVNKARLFEVLDKGKAAAVTTVIESRDASTNELIYENHSTVFIRDSGGFGGKRQAKDRGAATAANAPPKRKPDAVVEEKTSTDQAAIYRLSGDYNPLHIDPQFSIIGGFKKPILHGLCSMGFAGRHVLKTFGPYKDIKVRFTGTVIPGETLVTEMWKEGDKVIFQTKVKERDAPALSAAAVTLINAGAPKSKM
jgi:multifunctional beta-oxidation protein